MWKPLAITSGLLTLAAGGIMYTQVKNPLASEKEQATQAEGNQKKATLNKKDAGDAKAKADTALSDAKSELDTNQKAKLAAQQAKDEKVAEVEKAKGELGTLEKELADLEQKVKDYGGLEVLAGELKQLEAKKAELESKIAGTKDGITATIARKESTDKLVAGVKERDLWQKTGTMAASFTTRIRAVNAELGYVELGAGDSRNVVKQAKLFAMRGGSPVGRLIVTDLKPNSSIATIVPGSIAAGDSILPGDLVVVDSTSTPAALTSSTTTEKKDAPANKDAKKAATPAPGDVADPFATPGDATPVPDAAAPTPDAAAPAPDAATPAPDAATPAPAETPMSGQ